MRSVIVELLLRLLCTDVVHLVVVVGVHLAVVTPFAGAGSEQRDDKMRS